jgi:hypothetical protein
MDKHPFVGIKGVFVDLNSGELELRYLVNTLTSHSQIPVTGNVSLKLFHGSTNKYQIHHDTKNPFSKVHSHKTISSNDMENNIKYKNYYKEIELQELSDYNSLKGILQHLSDYLDKNGVLEVADPVSGKKYIFLCTGDNIDSIYYILLKNKNLFLSKDIYYNKIILDLKKIPLLLKLLGEKNLYYLKLAIDNHSYIDHTLSSYTNIVTDKIEKKIYEKIIVEDLD